MGGGIVPDGAVVAEESEELFWGGAEGQVAHVEGLDVKLVLGSRAVTGVAYAIDVGGELPTTRHRLRWSCNGVFVGGDG